MTDSEDKKDSRIAFVGTEKYRQELQKAALDHGVKVQEFLERAVTLYLKQLGVNPRPVAVAASRPANARWHAMLDEILADK